MADIFVSYARVDKARVAPLIAALEAQGWSIWWDPEITGGQEFDDLIARELDAARAAIVVWTPASVASRWVRGEARIAADRGILVPVQMSAPNLPIDARAIHTIPLDDWKDDAASRPFRDLVRALGTFLGTPSSTGGGAQPARPQKTSICVLPFTNMSGDVEQEYFSDGISEDIITDLSKISALVVASRNSAFAFKGKQVDLLQVARQLRVSHILEGSVRKAGNRVRITAQLIDGATNNHIWAERYDRDLSDIFALQDEISKAIVGALKLRLLPEERKALGQRGTTNAEAYRLFLMARQYATKQSNRYAEFAARLLEKAVELDPNYAAAWAKLARIRLGHRDVIADAGDPEAALNRAMEIDPNSAEALATRAHMMVLAGNPAEGEKRIRLALSLDPDSYEVHSSAANVFMLLHKFEEAIVNWEKAANLVDTDFASLSMAVQCYQAIGDDAGAKAAAQRALKRIDQELLQDPANSDALAHGVGLLVVLGERERAKEWASRAMLVDPSNAKMRYNLACAMALAGDTEAALGHLEPHFAQASADEIVWASKDGDLDCLRDDPRFKAMVATAEARLAAAAPKS
ncbi:MAG: TIR domain-containing protein [Alphaproteobacteria bacterium]